MRKLLRAMGAGAVLLTLGGCASTQLDRPAPSASEPAAQAVLAASQQAHGADAFKDVRMLTVRYDGKWASVGPSLQPVLSDTRYRRSSVEHLQLNPRVLTQVHRGPAGQKIVVRRPDRVEVRYDGVPSDDAEVQGAAALVADAYTLFLLGPFYFDRPGVTLTKSGEGKVDGVLCDEVLAVLRPGFGLAEEDRVRLSIDRENKQLRRVRFTLNGLDSTRGAEVDVTFSDFQRIDGVLWPTKFNERIRSPLRLPAHRWSMLDLQINQDFKQP